MIIRLKSDILVEAEASVHLINEEPLFVKCCFDEDIENAQKLISEHFCE